MPRKRTYTDEQFSKAVKSSISWNEVFGKLNLKVGGGQYFQFKRLAAQLNISTAHFLGQGWNKGDPNGLLKKPTPLSLILVKNSTYTNSNALRKRLISSGLKSHQCEICHRKTWNKKPIPIQLDHINGDRSDNRLCNLRIVCPNCHAQTDTYCGKNIGASGGI